MSIILDPDTGITVNRLTTGTTTVSTSPYVVADGDQTIYVDASSGAVTVTLPDLATNLGRRVTVRASDATNAITVERAGSDTIANALTSVTLSSARDYWTLEAGPSQWELVAGYEHVGLGTTNSATAWSDGTLNCESTLTLTVYPETWTFAKEFSTIPLSNNSGSRQSNDLDNQVQVQPTSTTQASVLTYDVYARVPKTTGVVSVYATGRWY